MRISDWSSDVCSSDLKRAAEEVVQFYIHDRTASITRPVRELKGFQKIALKPGERRTISFTLTRSDLMFVGPKMQWIAEPGDFDVWIAPSAEAGEPARGTPARA